MAKISVYKKLEQLLEQAENIVNNQLFDFRARWLMDKDFRTQTFEKNPDCVLTLKHMGQEIPFFPICNRTALNDPNFIDLAIKTAKGFEGNPSVDEDSVHAIIAKLTKLQQGIEQA